jgi:predicted dehydrogenase/threonine dehydrogenase-like Zn-dependent dehydrogenase
VKQILQHLRSGEIEVADVPCPGVRAGHLLVQTSASLISAGSERVLVEFAKAGLIAKARSQPDKVKQVLAKIKTDGLMPTLETVFSRLDEPMPLGYCNVGRVIEVGAGVEGFSVGDRVVSNGPHAEMVCVPSTLAARVPDAVDDGSASFTVLASIALHGVRLLKPELGERVVVVGLGLLGQLAVQLLQSSGCRVLGVDTNSARCELARSFGCEAVSTAEGADPVQAARAFSMGHGVDAVLVTASAKNDQIMHQSAQSCRKRGRIIMVGVVNLDLQRPDFYERELSFQVSCSYGPGRYDPIYESGRDYPRVYVPWTVSRNFEALLEAMAESRLDVRTLISRTLPQAEAADAYESIVNDPGVLGVVMTYPPGAPPTERVIKIPSAASRASTGRRPVAGVIGAGSFAKLWMLPAIKAAGAPVHAVASAGGVSGLHAARKSEAEVTTTDYRTILHSPDVSAVFITTRHNSHARMVVETLAAGKHVFVEKPLAMSEDELQQVRVAKAAHPDLQLMVGFNRRFAPHAVKAKQLLAGRSQPVAVNLMINAGDIPADHWLQDPAIGGGRIVGEGCHFIDLAMFLVGSPLVSVQAVMFGPDTGGVRDDKMTIAMGFADGSIANLNYWANGPKSYPKELVEVFSEGRVLRIENWRSLRAWNWSGVPRMKIRMDKGHKAEVREFLRRIELGGAPVIPFEQLDCVTMASFAAVRSAREGVMVRLATEHA